MCVAGTDEGEGESGAKVHGRERERKGGAWFFCLRQHSLLATGLEDAPKVTFARHVIFQVTELVYVHSKCMVVDDRYTIIGSGERVRLSLVKRRLI